MTRSKSKQRPRERLQVEPKTLLDQNDTRISERARKYRKRCRNIGIPRYLSDASDPVEGETLLEIQSN